MDIRFCERCHESIPDADFDAGRAVSLEGSHLHVACALQRAARAGGPRSWIAFLLALVALGLSVFLFAERGGERAAGVEPEVRTLVADASRGATDAAAQHAEGLVRPEREARTELERRVTQLADAVRIAKDELTSRVVEGEKGPREGLAQVQDRLGRLEKEVADVTEWIARMARRAEEAARAGETYGPDVPAEPKPAEPKPPAPAPTPEPAAPAPTPPEPAPTPSGPPAQGPEHDAEVARWIERLKDTNEGIAFSATIELGRLKDLRAVPPLVDVLRKHKDFYARLGAATALQQLVAVDAVPALTEALNDGDDLVRTAADEALRVIADPALTSKDREETEFQANMGVQDRRRVMARWRKWWQANETALREKRGQPVVVKSN